MDVKRSRGTISIAPDSLQLRLYQFYIDMGGSYVPLENLCRYGRALVFWAPFYFLTRKKVVSDLTILNIGVLLLIAGLFLAAILANPLIIISAIFIFVVMALIITPISENFKRVIDWYISGHNKKLASIKIVGTLCVLFGGSTYFFGFNNSWALLKQLIIVLGVCVSIFVAAVGILVSLIFLSEKIKERNSIRKQKLASMAYDTTTSPSIKENDSILRVLWAYLKTLKENYLCPFIEFPEGAIKPRGYNR